MAARIVLLVSPVLLCIPTALFASGHRWISLIALILVNVGVRTLVRQYAGQSGRDGDLWGIGGFFFPLIVPIVLALMPPDPNSQAAQFRAVSGTTRAKAAGGSLEERFPLLTQCLAGQPEATRCGLMARFRAVRTNFEFLLPTTQTAIARLLAEAQDRKFVTWTGTNGNVPLVYGAGLVGPAAVEETGRWLSSAGAPGEKLTIAVRDADGVLQFIEHRFEPASGARA